MLVIGLTGPSGAGKSVVAKIFAAFDLPVIDADRVYHELLVPPSPCLDALTERFGVGILNTDGTLNRRTLGQTVFADPDALSSLNAIAHRYVMEEIHRQMQRLRRADTRAMILDAPQLFEAGADKDCNIIVSVLSDKRLRLERIMLRDGIDAQTAQARINAQKSDEFFRAHSNYVIENDGNPEHLYMPVKRILCETGVLTS